jgi:hypothetical protein
LQSSPINTLQCIAIEKISIHQPSTNNSINIHYTASISMKDLTSKPQIRKNNQNYNTGINHLPTTLWNHNKILGLRIITRNRLSLWKNNYSIAEIKIWQKYAFSTKEIKNIVSIWISIANSAKKIINNYLSMPSIKETAFNTTNKKKIPKIPINLISPI